jgi:hypothetical protein
MCVLALAMRGDAMYVLSFTDSCATASGNADTGALAGGAGGHAAAAPAGARESEDSDDSAVPPDVADGGLEALALQADAERGASGLVPDAMLEVHKLDLLEWRWSRVNAQVSTGHCIMFWSILSELPSNTLHFAAAWCRVRSFQC